MNNYSQRISSRSWYWSKSSYGFLLDSVADEGGGRNTKSCPENRLLVVCLSGWSGSLELSLGRFSFALCRNLTDSVRDEALELLIRWKSKTVASPLELGLLLDSSMASKLSLLVSWPAAISGLGFSTFGFLTLSNLSQGIEYFWGSLYKKCCLPRDWLTNIQPMIGRVKFRKFIFY